MLREQYVKTVLVGYLLWPLAHIINFKFIPTDLRILYVNWYAHLFPILPSMHATVGHMFSKCAARRMVTACV